MHCVQLQIVRLDAGNSTVFVDTSSLIWFGVFWFGLVCLGLKQYLFCYFLLYLHSTVGERSGSKVAERGSQYW